MTLSKMRPATLPPAMAAIFVEELPEGEWAMMEEVPMTFTGTEPPGGGL